MDSATPNARQALKLLNDLKRFLSVCPGITSAEAILLPLYRLVETARKAKVYKVALDALLDTMAAGAWQSSPPPKDGSWILALFHGWPYVVYYTSRSGWRSKAGCLADCIVSDGSDPTEWARIIHPDRQSPAMWDSTQVYEGPK
jgi:hypothetical protein